jgi:hypothetical protein
MADRGTLPSDQEVRSYMRKLKAFRDSLAPREQRMLDAVVVAAYWPDAGGDTQAYGLPMPTTIYDDTTGLPPIQMIPWGKVLGNI